MTIPLWAVSYLASDRQLLVGGGDDRGGERPGRGRSGRHPSSARRRPTRPAWLAASAAAVVLALAGGVPALSPHGPAAAAVLLAVAVAVLAGSPGRRPDVAWWLLDIVLALSGWAVVASVAGFRPFGPVGLAAVLVFGVATGAALRLGSPDRPAANSMRPPPGGRHTLRRIECRLRHADGGWRDTQSVVVSLLSDPRIRGMVLTTRDVSARRRLEADLTRAAFTDSLTGLAGRALFRERVERALEATQRTNAHHVVVIFCDLDGFKAVNDSEGHAVGGQLLCAVAGRIQECVRPSDTVARLGGDEFAILVTGTGSDEAAMTITQRVAGALSEPFRIGGRELYVGNSAGIASTSSGADTAELLMQSADLAMYRAKTSPETACVLFRPAMREDLLISVAMAAELVQAQARGEFTVHYQPIVDLETGRIRGGEALLRWLHPVRGVVPTAEYLRLAEQSGSIVPLGEWALARR